MGLLGMIARERRDYDEAMEHFQRGLVLMRQAGAPTGAANALHNIGIVHAELGQNDQALAHMQESFALLEAHGEVRGTAMVMHDMAHVHFDSFRDEESASWAERSLAAYRESGDWRSQALALADFAYWRYETGDLAAARGLVREMTALCRAYTNLPDDQAVLAAMEDVRDHIGQVALLVALSLEAQVDGRLLEALGLVRGCLEIVRATSRWWPEDRLLGQLSTLHLALGDRETAVRYGEEAVAAADRRRQPRAVATAARILATATVPTSTGPAAPAP